MIRKRKNRNMADRGGSVIIVVNGSPFFASFSLDQVVLCPWPILPGTPASSNDIVGICNNIEETWGMLVCVWNKRRQSAWACHGRPSSLEASRHWQASTPQLLHVAYAYVLYSTVSAGLVSAPAPRQAQASQYARVPLVRSAHAGSTVLEHRTVVE